MKRLETPQGRLGHQGAARRGSQVGQFVGEVDGPRPGVGADGRGGGFADENARAQVDALIAAFATPWFRYFLQFDPTDALRRIRAPVLALGGERDSVESLFVKLDLEGLVNTLSASLPLTVVEKQSLLESATAEQRFHRLCEVLRYRVAEAKLGLDAARGTDA